MRVALIISLAFTLAAAERFSPQDVKILGDIDYGQTSAALTCGEETRYCALVFNAMSKDRIEATVKGDAETMVAFADGELTELARGKGTLALTLPDFGTDPSTFYVIFSGAERAPAKVTVTLKKL